MNQTAKETGGTGPSHRSVEVGVAVFMALLALIGIFGSIKVGIGWGDEGPRAGFFPFYVSLIVLLSCAVNVRSVLTGTDRGQLFAEWGQLWLDRDRGRFGRGADLDLPDVRKLVSGAAAEGAARKHVGILEYRGSVGRRDGIGQQKVSRDGTNGRHR